jgi:hypothetical protein
MVRREILKAAGLGATVTLVVGVLIIIGSRNLAHFDAALVGYTFAVLFATFGITYRYSMWLQRPPTALYWRRGWRVFFTRRSAGQNARRWFDRMFNDILMNRFIRHRNRMRWLAHMMLMWGCILAFAITIPLVFGWLHFETVAGQLDMYRVFVFGFPMFEFPTGSLPAFLLFHGLVWASFLVIGGVMLAMRRRARDHGAAAVQMFGEDFLPLILLFAVSITGLMLTASYSWMHGLGYEFLAILHAITVIFTLLWLPFGKFFHIFQRPAQLGVSFYRDAGLREKPAVCARCAAEYAPQMQIDDLITVEEQLGYDYRLNGPGVDHYQRVCPACRRAMLGLAQGRVWRDAPVAP